MGDPTFRVKLTTSEGKVIKEWTVKDNYEHDGKTFDGETLEDKKLVIVVGMNNNLIIEEQ